MKNRTLYAVLTRFGIVAALLTTLLVIAPAATAQEVGGECNDDFECTYPENGTGPVATFSATDEDGDEIDWDVDGVDKGAFEIDGGVLTFKDPPDFEGPADKDESDDVGDQGKGDNVYKVTVIASGGSQAVEVTVTNVNEDGEVTFTQPQPQVDRGLEAKLKDEDGKNKPKWQWSRGPSMDGPWEAIEGAKTASRTPVVADVGSYLQATVTYTDEFGEQMASGVTGTTVEARTLANAAPEFDEVDPIPVDENVKGAIGDPIVATDADNDQLLYSLEKTGDHARFSIDESGQLSLKKALDFELTGPGTATDDAERDASAADRAAVTDDDTDADPDTNDAVDEGEDGDDDMVAYMVTVVAMDPSSAPGMVTVTVNLMNVNEAPEFGKNAPKELMLWENESGQQLLVPDTDSSDDEVDDADDANESPPYTPYDESKTDPLPETAYAATDEDILDNNADDDPNTLRYGLEGGDKSKFAIDATTGALTFTGTADYEKKSSFSVTIVATSGGNTVDSDNDDAPVRSVSDVDRTSYGKFAVTVKVVDDEDPGTVMLSAREPQVKIPGSCYAR